MMMKKTKVVFTALHVMAGVLLFLTGRYLFPVCHFVGMDIPVAGGGSVPMKCFYTQDVINIYAAVIVIISLGKHFFARERVLDIFKILFYALVLLSAWWVPGVCNGPTMPCHSQTRPVWTVISSFGILLSLFELLTVSSSAKHLNVQDY